ncbi:MAG: LptE family protein [Bdellovibrionales bacterium]|nr:LptE family protein [Bdellovibrionales bacterium]
MPNMKIKLQFFKFICVLALLASAAGVSGLFLTGCAYRFGYMQRDLPGGYKEVAIPVFQNKTGQVAIEGYFTNELIRQFSRSQVAKVADPDHAPVTIEGKINSVEFIHRGQVDGNNPGDSQVRNPENTVLTLEYRVLVNATVLLRRNSDQKVLWQGAFDNESVYSAPQVGIKIANSVNPLYNNSARVDVIARMARDMMAEAHDRMTENF